MTSDFSVTNKQNPGSCYVDGRDRLDSQAGATRPPYVVLGMVNKCIKRNESSQRASWVVYVGKVSGRLYV